MKWHWDKKTKKGGRAQKEKRKREPEATDGGALEIQMRFAVVEMLRVSHDAFKPLRSPFKDTTHSWSRCHTWNARVCSPCRPQNRQSATVGHRLCTSEVRSVIRETTGDAARTGSSVSCSTVSASLTTPLTRPHHISRRNCSSGIYNPDIV